MPSVSYELELSFINSVLYLKVVIAHSMLGYLFCIFAFSAALIAILLFTSHTKPDLPEFDVTITYRLLIGAMILDIIALLRLSPLIGLLWRREFLW